MLFQETLLENGSNLQPLRRGCEKKVPTPFWVIGQKATELNTHMACLWQSCSPVEAQETSDREEKCFKG